MAIGCYTPKYAQFSFKGVSAICIDADLEGGRRGAEGEMPFSEVSAYADLGRKIKRFRLKVVFRENSHLADALRFFRTCESPGPGTLVHPLYGAVRAACKSIRVQDSPENHQGETTADVEFVEANSGLGGLVSSLLGLAVGPVLAATATYFAANFRPSSTPFFALGAIGSVARSSVMAIHAELQIAAGMQDDSGYWQVTHDLGALAAGPAMAEPGTAWLGLSGGVAAIDRYGRSPDAKIDAYRRLANRAAALPRAPAAATTAQESVVITQRVLAAAYMARAALTIPTATMQDGFVIYDRVVTLLDNEIMAATAACNNGLHLALTQFSADTQAALLARIYDLPPIVEYDFHRGVPSIVAAHSIYGDAKKFGMIERYNARHLPYMIGPKVVAPRADISFDLYAGT